MFIKKIFNDSFSNILNDDSIDNLKLKAKLYFDVCIPNLKFDNIDILSTITGTLFNTNLIVIYISILIYIQSFNYIKLLNIICIYNIYCHII